MGKLKVLPASMANLIAAGEVVQRPASVVKELMENAVDAGAGKVSVIITDAGRTLIQVIDDGCGMSPSDAALCFERHATSKIALPEDLSAISTYGFRGEALPSIAAVAEVTLKTRLANRETGTQVVVGGGSDLVTSSVAAPKGSNFAVRNLFYNTPARRKFLKSDAAEFRHIVEEFTRVALVRPEVAFSLSHNGKDIYSLRAAQSLKFRIQDLFGGNLADELSDLELTTSTLTLRGYLGRPDTAKKTAGAQFFFVNGRYFRSTYLHKAVMSAYEGLIPEGVTPSYFIFIETPPAMLDVNVHPSKIDVKFENEPLVYQTIFGAVKQSLGKSAFGAVLDFSEPVSDALPQVGMSFSEYKGAPVTPSTGFDPNYNPFEPEKEAAHDIPATHDIPYHSHVSPRENYGALFDGISAPNANLLVIQNKYIIAPAESGMMVVNIRRAWERILYERALKALDGVQHVSQTALFPVQVQVGVQNRLIFEEHAEQLASLGFDITPFGTDTVVVNAVPEIYSCEEGKIRRMVEDLILILSDNVSALPEVMKSSLASKIATLGALNSTSFLSVADARQFLDTLFACNNAELTAEGRKTLVLIKADEIEKKF
ncbi:MAG: DNA mismatch repair endonuclease MutL [Bacteroidales bacterium]|nr:DNA mismatch repair endonuclease MutL [Bacteroidales bacterium]